MTRPRTPRAVCLDPLAMARLRATRLTDREVHDYMHPLQACARYLREGVATEDQHGVVHTAVLLAQAIEDSRIMRGLQGHITAAHQAIEAIGQRARTTGEWVPTGMYFQEMEVLDTILEFHEHQIAALSSGELHRLARKVIHTARSAGQQVTHLQPEQLRLLAA